MTEKGGICFFIEASVWSLAPEHPELNVGKKNA